MNKIIAFLKKKVTTTNTSSVGCSRSHGAERSDKSQKKTALEGNSNAVAISGKACRTVKMLSAYLPCTSSGIHLDTLHNFLMIVVGVRLDKLES